jgi:hypothetical protein
METSRMLPTSGTDQRNSRRRLHTLLNPSHKSTNLQEFVDNISIATHIRNSTVSTFAMIRLSKHHATVMRWSFPFGPTDIIYDSVRRRVRILPP